MPFDTADLRGTYTGLKAAPRNLPTDEVIEQVRLTVPDNGWRWVYGMLAAFGLRPHEVFRMVSVESMADGGAILQLSEDTKTGARYCWALHPRWVDKWGLLEAKRPDLDLSKPNENLGHQVSQAFVRYRLPFPAYNLRHAWCVRALTYNLDTGLAAQMAGHSLAVHQRQYWRWIRADHHRRAYEQLMLRPNRP